MRQRVSLKRYARALVEVAEKMGALQQVGDELRGFADLLATNSDLSTFFQNPAILLKDKKQVFDMLAKRSGLSPMVESFVGFLLEKGEIWALPRILRVYEEMSDERLNRTKAIVTSAVPLADGERRTVLDRLTALTGKTVYLEEKVDPSLLGGLKIQVKSTVYDGTLRARLTKIREQLLNAS
ncbi:MAG: ATP synthase F1 subunit delta [candidate division NC10 bacterium]|nr:ATP synthase F1 subunit delta [candidate division NC10 bacterium]